MRAGRSRSVRLTIGEEILGFGPVEPAQRRECKRLRVARSRNLCKATGCWGGPGRGDDGMWVHGLALRGTTVHWLAADHAVQCRPQVIAKRGRVGRARFCKARGQGDGQPRRLRRRYIGTSL